MGLNSRRWWMPVAVRNVWARAIWRRSLRRPPPRRPVGWMGHWALKRFPSSPYLAARSVIQDALCIYIAGSSSSSSSSIGINWACPKGEERRGDSWQKRKKGFPHLIVVGYIYGLLGSKDDVFLALGYPKQPNEEPLMFWWQRQGISEKMLLLSAFHNAAAPPTMQSEVVFFKLKFVSKVRELLSAPAVPC